MDTSNWMIANWILTGIGAIGGLPMLIAAGYYMFKYLFPLKITLLETAYCEYDNIRREYIIVVPRVEVHVRRPTTPRNKCIRFKGSKYCFPSLNAEYERMEKTNIYDIRFTTEIYDEEDMAESPLSNQGARAQIVFGRCKSAWFPIARVTAIVLDEKTAKKVRGEL